MTVAQVSDRQSGTFLTHSASHPAVTFSKRTPAKRYAIEAYASRQSSETLKAIAAQPIARNLKQLSDAELVCLCQSQSADRVAFTELIRRYQPHVDKLLYHFSLEFSDRADLSQEVWIRVYRYIPRLKEANRFKPWLSRITTNLFYDTLRKRKRFAGIVSLDASRRTDEGDFDWEVASDEPSPVDIMMTQEFYERLQTAIAKLPEIFQETIRLREIKGLPYDEIAEITGVSLGTVKSRIARARDRLQDELKIYLG